MNYEKLCDTIPAKQWLEAFKYWCKYHEGLPSFQWIYEFNKISKNNLNELHQ